MPDVPSAPSPGERPAPDQSGPNPPDANRSGDRPQPPARPEADRYGPWAEGRDAASLALMIDVLTEEIGRRSSVAVALDPGRGVLMVGGAGINLAVVADRLLTMAPSFWPIHLGDIAQQATTVDTAPPRFAPWPQSAELVKVVVRERQLGDDDRGVSRPIGQLLSMLLAISDEHRTVFVPPSTLRRWAVPEDEVWARAVDNSRRQSGGRVLRRLVAGHQSVVHLGMTDNTWLLAEPDVLLAATTAALRAPRPDGHGPGDRPTSPRPQPETLLALAVNSRLLWTVPLERVDDELSTGLVDVMVTVAQGWPPGAARRLPLDVLVIEDGGRSVRSFGDSGSDTAS